MTSAVPLETDYSQYGEQAVILANTPPIGRLLDIGAWHATQLSNSRALIERGWEAMLVEPSPEPFMGLLKEYGNNPKVTLINAAIGFERCFVKFHATADAVTTSDESSFKKWSEIGGFYGSFYAPVFTLGDLLNQFGGNLQFVNIDVEGSSVDVFNALMATGSRPNVVCVEHDDRIVEINQNAAAVGYRQLLLNGTNVVFGL